MRYRAIQEHDRRFPIRLMCRALAVSPAGYYAWRVRPERERGGANRALAAKIRVIHRESRETYGSPSIWDALVKQGHSVGEHRIARLMRTEGIRAKTVKKWRATLSPIIDCPSRRRRGNCWDNACVESFFGTLKRELIYHRQYRTRDEATQDIFEYIEVFYNRLRRHSTLGYYSPAEFEARTAVA